jgi:hypothetical protein
VPEANALQPKQHPAVKCLADRMLEESGVGNVPDVPEPNTGKARHCPEENLSGSFPLPVDGSAHTDAGVDNDNVDRSGGKYRQAS